MLKRIILIAVSVLLVATVYIALMTFDRDLGVPHDYPNSEWVSEDGTVTIRIKEEAINEMEVINAYVSIRDGDVEREATLVYRSYDGGGRIMYVRESQSVYEKDCEIWTVKKFSETEFTVKVSHIEDGAPIFEDDSLVTFYRVDDAF